MAALTWTDELALRQPRMDQTHREFVDLLGELEGALEVATVEIGRRLDAFLAHTAEHFAQEERWMSQMGFAPENCHSRHHAGVLGVLREVKRRLAEDNDVAIVRQLVPEMAQWFRMHAQSMDAALAQTMSEVGYDPETGTYQRPLVGNGEAPHTGCGAQICS